MILQHPNKILRQKSAEVPVKEIKGLKIQNIIKRMKETLVLNMEESKGGVALAAPQIGCNLRIFIILEDLLKINKETNSSERTAMFRESAERKPRFIVFINPEIIKSSKKKQILKEGCLSLEGVYGKVKRPEKLTVRALNENSEKFQMSATKIMAEAIEHEIDHLDGVLFIDKVLANSKSKL